MMPKSFSRSGLERGAAVALLVIGIQIMMGLTALCDGHDMALQLRRNVVSLTVTNGEQTDYGFGFVVGESNGRLVVVTARHVVVCEGPPGCEASIVARFYGQAGTYQATLWETDADIDLALLSVEAPSGYVWEVECFDDAKPAPDTPVWSIGLNQDWEIPLRSTPGYIRGSDITGARLSVVETVVGPGSSGAPLIAQRGIVGMIQSDDPMAHETRALCIGTIRAALEEWGVPWGLSVCPDDGDDEPDPPPGTLWSLAIEGQFLLAYELMTPLAGLSLELGEQFSIRLEALAGISDDSLASIGLLGFRWRPFSVYDRLYLCVGTSYLYALDTGEELWLGRAEIGLAPSPGKTGLFLYLAVMAGQDMDYETVIAPACGLGIRFPIMNLRR